MSREIQFRAWNQLTKNWTTEGFSIERCNGGCWITLKSAYIVLMQFIGLKDKLSKEIYEGDIVRGKNVDYFRPDEIICQVVTYQDGGFYPFADNNDYAPYPRSEDVEVIGNIYENPELLKKVV